jgi:predicted ferric reductase
MSSNVDLDNLPPAMALNTLLLLLLGVIAGAFAAVVTLPTLLPGLTHSLLGDAPKAYWYLSRASAFVAYGLLWFAMLLGVIITNKMARLWPGGPVAFDLHQHASLLGLVFALFHGLILLGDHYIHFTVARVIIPFATVDYRPAWVGLGQIGFYLLALVGLSFYVRRFIGTKLWRLIHFLSFLTYALALTHGIASGTDTKTVWAQNFYWATGGSLLFFIMYRILVSVFRPAPHRVGMPDKASASVIPNAAKSV